MGFTLYCPAYFGADVRRLEGEAAVAYVAGTPESQASDHLGRQVRDDVAVEVRRDEHIVVEGVLQEPHRHRVDVRIVDRDAGVVLRDLARGFEEEAVGRANDVRLVDDRHLLPARPLREFERGADYPLRALLRVDLARHGILVGRKRSEGFEGLRQSLQRGRELLWNRLLDAGSRDPRCFRGRLTRSRPSL